MSRLVVASNRVADLTKRTQTGGLAVGLADAIRSRGGIWFGWNGEISETTPEKPDVEAVGDVQMISTPVSQEDHDRHYLGFSNSVLWPLFHYRLDLVDYRDRDYEGYRRVNALFAAMLVPHLRPDDVIWIHDYQLLTMARELRRLGCRQRIGFFLHIPFPPQDILSAAPHHTELVDGLLAHDLIGFQTQLDVENFRNYLETHSGEAAGSERLPLDPADIEAHHFPIGIDVDSFRSMAEKATEDVLIDRVRRGILGRKQIIGVDRLDYSKGLPDRMRAFERLLALYPQHQYAVSYLQIAPPTREKVNAYAEIRQELEGLAGAVNGKYADFNWTPIKYIHRSIERQKLAGLFRTSDVGLVVPLRDGMNLVAKEYVAAQDPDDPGVLVLSRFAGAAEDLEEALLVNPYDVDSVAKSLNDALQMPLEERIERHAALLERVRQRDANAWLTSFLERLTGTGAGSRADDDVAAPAGQT